MAMPPTNLTGQARFRRSFFGQRLILEVEENRFSDRAVSGPATSWRDAEMSDLWKLRMVRERKKLEPLL